MKKPWTDEEIELMKKYNGMGCSNEEIAQKLGRTKGAVKVKKARESIITQPIEYYLQEIEGMLDIEFNKNTKGYYVAKRENVLKLHEGIHNLLQKEEK